MKRTFILELEPGQSVEAALGQLKGNPDVEYAEPNYQMKLFLAPNDVNYNLQWGLANTGQTGGQDGWDPSGAGTVGADIDAQLAWDVQTGNSSVVIAVLDTGADLDHPDLVSNLWNNSDEIPGNLIDDDGNGYVDDVVGFDFGDSDSTPEDDAFFDSGHGTHVAGIIGAVGNNSAGVSGVNMTTSLMICKVGDIIGLIQTSALASAITYAANNGAHVINMSLGGPDSSTIQTAIDFADASGVLMIAAAGNDNTSDTSFSYPAAYDNVVSVAATDRNDQKSAFSNYGSWVDISAPGTAILSTYLFGSYVYLSGTSMAAPMVVGAAGLIKAQYSSLTASQIKVRLTDSGESIEDLNPAYPGLLGRRLNARAALLSASSVSPATGFNFESVSLTITGVSFASGDTFRLTKTGESSISATGVSVPSNTSMTGTVNLSGATPGVWDLEVVSGNLVQALNNAFTIEAISVGSVSPAVGAVTENSVTLSITGTNFVSGTSFRLRKSGVSDLEPLSVTLNSLTSASVDFDLTQGIGGRYDVVAVQNSVEYTGTGLYAITSETFDVVVADQNSNNFFTLNPSQGSQTISWPAGITNSSVDLDLDASPSLPTIDSSISAYQHTNIGIEISPTSVSNVSFNSGFSLTLSYRLSDLPDPSKEESLTIATYDTTRQAWIPETTSFLNTNSRTVTATINHLSMFALVQHAPAANLDRAKAYPNPFRPDQGHTQLIFDFLSTGSRIRIYDVAGELIRDLDDSDSDGIVHWPVTTESGEKVASGIYFFMVTDDQGNKKVGRFGVVR